MSGTGGWRRRDYYLMGIGFQFDKMKRVVEMDGDGGCTIMWMYLMPLNSILKMVKIVNFMLGVFYHN